MRLISNRCRPAFQKARSLARIFFFLCAILVISFQPALAGTWKLHATVSFTHFANGLNFGSPPRPLSAIDATNSIRFGRVDTSVGSSSNKSSTASVTLNATVTGTWIPDPSLPSDPVPLGAYAKVDLAAWASGQSGPATSVTNADDGVGDPALFVPNVQGKNYVMSSGTHIFIEPNPSFTLTFSESAKCIDFGNIDVPSLAAAQIGDITITMGASNLSLYDCASSWSTHLDFSDSHIGYLNSQMIAAQEARTPFKTVVGAAVDGTSKVLLEYDTLSSAPVTFSTSGPGANLYLIPGDPVLRRDGSYTVYAWYAVYSVPDVSTAFPTVGQMSNTVTFTATCGPKTDSQPLMLGRDPVVLVHGLWDKAASWTAPTGVRSLLKAAGFFVSPVDYQNTNHSSFEANKDTVLEDFGGIKDVVNSYHADQWAISKTDVVGHSMGNMITRYFASQPKYMSVDNYYKGYVHRLVTIGAPHLGSPESELYWWFYLSYMTNRDLWAYSFLKAASLLNPSPPGLAVRDLSPGSAASQRIHTPSFPATLPAFAEVGNAAPKGDSVSKLADWFIARDRYTGNTPGSVFIQPNLTDTVVSDISQQGSLLGPYFTLTNSIVHVPIPFVSFASEMHSTVIGNDIVKQLFADNFDFNGFPSPPGVDTNDGLRLPNMTDPYPLMMVDLNGLPLPSPLGFAATVTVSSPSPGQTFSPGDSVSVTFTPNSGTTIESAVINASAEGGALLGMSIIAAAPYTTTFTIPQTILGNVKVTSVACDTAGNISLADTNITVNTSATLLAAALTPTTMPMIPITLTGVGVTVPFQVSGSYSDQVIRDITLYQTQYSSSNPSVATVSNTGLVTAVANGVSQITATNGSVSSTIPVTVALQAPLVLAVSPLGANAGQTVALRLDGMNFGGASSIQFLTPAGQLDPNVVASGVTLSPNGYMLTANVAIAQNCPAIEDTIVVTAGGGSSDPLSAGDYGSFTVLPSTNTLTLSSNTAQGIQTIPGTVLLSAPAPTGGVTITLSSSDPSVSVPASITIDPGCISKTFPVTTSQVAAPTPVTITATSGGVNATSVLTESP